jgi:hypothetical protein
MVWFWLNMPLAAAFFAAWVAIPMWLVLKRPDRGTVPPPLQARTQQAVPAELPLESVPYRAEQLVGV